MFVGWLALLFCASSLVHLSVAEDESSAVVVLTSDNFESVIKENKFVLVEFYAPWCGHCKELAPKYEKTAAQMKSEGSEVVIANCDATVEKHLAEKYEIQGFPTFKLFRDGNLDSAQAFEADRTVEGIVTELKKLTDPDYVPPPSDVVDLTSDNFDEFINKHDISLVEFYAPWCGHCKALAPEYEKAAADLKEDGIMLAKVDATKETKLATDYSITGYPTLFIFRKGTKYEYTGDSQYAPQLAHEMRKQSKPASEEVNSAQELKKLMEKNPETVIGVFTEADKTTDLHKYYMESTLKHRGDIKFYHTYDEEVIKKLKVGHPMVGIFLPQKFQSPGEPRYKAMNHAFGSEQFSEFYEENRYPIVGEFKRPGKYDKKLPLLLVYYHVDFDNYEPESLYWVKKLISLATHYHSVTFAVADEEKYAEDLKNVGLDLSGSDVNAILYDKDGSKYPLVTEEDFSDEVLQDFLEDWKDGSLKPHLKSQKRPKKQTNPVTVVGDTFEEIVMDKSKDVLIELYAPWCGHCKQLEPIYKEFAESSKSDKRLVVAKMDATANDAPASFKADGFPTIFYRSRGKTEPVLFKGARTVEGFKKFVEEQRERRKDEL